MRYYETVAREVFDNKGVLETYCQADVTVLREACRAFCRHFLHIGHVDDFLKTVTIASACKKTLRNKFMQPDRIGITQVGDYTYNRKQCRKAIAWLMLEKTGKRNIRGRNGKERQRPKVPGIRVDGLCEETRTVYEFNGCYWHGHTYMTFRETLTACWNNTLAETYENTMSRLERYTRAGYRARCCGNADSNSPKLRRWRKDCP
jgi:hypothetical protein